VSTFDHFDDDANLTDGNTQTNYETAGEVPGIDSNHTDDRLCTLSGVWISGFAKPLRHDHILASDLIEIAT
jgi:hypothetical protein